MTTLANDPAAAPAPDSYTTGDPPMPSDRSRGKAPMLTIAEIRAEHTAMKEDVAKAHARLAVLDGEVQRIKADASRHPDYIREKIAEAQAKATPAIAEIVRTFDDRLAPVMGQRRYWASKPLLLSLQTFDEDAVRDAAIRSRYAAEFAAMPPAWLQLMADEAIDADNLPVLYQAQLAGIAHAGKPGWEGISLNAVEIPDQAEALLLIDKCKALTHQAHLAWSMALGKVQTGLGKLASAYQTAASR